MGSRALSRKINRSQEAEKEKQKEFYLKQIKFLRRPGKVAKENNNL